jgi:hypothetical protein
MAIRKAVSDKTILKAYKATGNSVTKTAKRVSRCYMAVRLRLQKLGKIAK